MIFLTVREASFVAELAPAKIDKLIDAGEVPERALRRRDRERLFTETGVVALAVDVAAMRLVKRSVRAVWRNLINARMRVRLTPPEVVAVPFELDLGGVRGRLDFSQLSERLLARLAKVRRMHQLIVEDPDIQAGAPTFKGTRVLVRPIVAALEDGVAPAELREDYRLTDEQLELAQLFVQIKPARGRPIAGARGRVISRTVIPTPGAA